MADGSPAVCRFRQTDRSSTDPRGIVRDGVLPSDCPPLFGKASDGIADRGAEGWDEPWNVPTDGLIARTGFAQSELTERPESEVGDNMTD